MLNQLIARLRNNDDLAVASSSSVVAAWNALVYSKVNKIHGILSPLSPRLRKECVNKFIKDEASVLTEDTERVMLSIREVLKSKTSKNLEDTKIRSTLLSAACGPQVSLKSVSAIFGIYAGNHMKLNKYRQRRHAYLSGESKNMDGDRYASKNYGFPQEVLDIARQFFKSPDCGTPDK